jgi:hypothetical protein
LIGTLVGCKGYFQSRIIAAAIGVHQPKEFEDRKSSHAALIKKISKQTQGAYHLLYRNDQFVSLSNIEEFYDFDVWIFNKYGQTVDLNEVAGVCETTDFGYKEFKRGMTMDQMIWEPDTSSLDMLFAGLETIDGATVRKENFPDAKYFFVQFYAEYAPGPQRRKQRLLRKNLDFKNDSIVSIFINADFIKSDSLVINQYAQKDTIE